MMDDDGNNANRLTKIGAGHPALSPDGRKVAFVSPSLERIAGFFTLQIYVVDVTGGNERMLTRSTSTTG